jgi:hypothetical protein
LSGLYLLLGFQFQMGADLAFDIAITASPH